MRKLMVLAVMALVMAMGSASAGAQPAFIEDFEDGDVAGWWADTWLNTKASIEAVATPISPSGGNYVGKVTFAASCIGPRYFLDPATPDYISWYFRADGDTGHSSGLAFGVGQYISTPAWGGWMAFISYHQGALRYETPGVYHHIMSASMGTWYLIELKNIDWDSDTFDMWVDGVEKVVGVPFVDDIDAVNHLMNYACPWASGPSYVDDITFGFYDGEGPVVTDVVASLNPVAVGSAVTLTANVDDSTTGGSDIASAEYNIDAGPFVAMSAGDGTFDEVSEDVTASVSAFTEPGLHTVCVHGTDARGNVGADECILLPVYDPTAGFVTGGGWVNSSAGADADNPSAAGRATFGFVSKYQKGRTTPDGSLEFQFKAGDLNFKSTSMEWLVVTGEPRAQFRGEGTINGATVCKFQVDAWDDSFGAGVDAFGIRITACGGGDRYSLDATPLEGGSIMIHKK